MPAAVLTRSFAAAVARLPARPQTALRAYRATGLSRAAPRSLRHLQAPPLPAAGGRGPRHQQLRCLASRRDDEPSWSDIASEAGQVAKCVGSCKILLLVPPPRPPLAGVPATALPAASRWFAPLRLCEHRRKQGMNQPPNCI